MEMTLYIRQHEINEGFSEIYLIKDVTLNQDRVLNLSGYCFSDCRVLVASAMFDVSPAETGFHLLLITLMKFLSRWTKNIFNSSL